MHDFHRRLLALVQNGHDLTMRQECVLLACAEQPRTPGTLATDLRIGAGRITHAVDALARLGLAKRTNHQSDRRVKLIELTAKGRRLVEETLR